MNTSRSLLRTGFLFLLLAILSVFAVAKGKPQPTPEPSWSVYIPFDSYGIQGASMTTCGTASEIDCPADIPDGSYVYTGGTTENNARYHFLKLSAPFDGRTEFDFKFSDDGFLSVKLGLDPPISCSEGLSAESSLECVLSSEQPNNLLTHVWFQFYSDWGFNFEAMDVGDTEPSIDAWFRFEGDPAYLYSASGSKSEANDLTVTRISENVWHIEYLPATESNFACRLHLMEYEDCVRINKHREECTYQFNTESSQYTLPAFDLYFVREKSMIQ